MHPIFHDPSGPVDNTHPNAAVANNDTIRLFPVSRKQRYRLCVECGILARFVPRLDVRAPSGNSLNDVAKLTIFERYFSTVLLLSAKRKV